MASAHPIHVFFASFTDLGFIHNASFRILREWKRLNRVATWDADNAEEMLHRFRRAVAAEFCFLFGTDLGDLGALQRLCALVLISPPPVDVDGCRKALKRIYVNIYDLIDAELLGEEPRLHDTEVALANYTKKGRVFPLEDAKGNLMEYMLRQIKHPRKPRAKV